MKKLKLNRETVKPLDLRSVVAGDEYHPCSCESRCIACPDPPTGKCA